jgi:VanZ family protein
MRLSLAAARGAFLVLFIAITYLTLTPNPDDTEPGFVVTRWLSTALTGNDALADKIAHFLCYAALGAMAYFAELRLFSRRWGPWAALCVYGVLLEILQGLGGVRDPEVADAVANALGAASGLAGAALLAHLVRRVRRAI